MIESETERGDKVEREKRYYLCSTKLGVETFARVARGHWGVESVPQRHTERSSP
jgi:hypothetical protein